MGTQVQHFIVVVLATLLSTSLLPLVCEAVYSLSDTSVKNDTDGRSFTAKLQFNGNNNSDNGTDIQELNLQVRYESNDRLRVYITDSAKKRYEIPNDVVGRGAGGPKNSPELKLSWTKNPFGFAVTRTSNGEVLFNSTPNGQDQNGNGPFGAITFQDQYLEISTALPSNASLYGLGESTRPGFRLDSNERQHTLWNSDVPSLSTFQTLYGSHPFYMDVRDKGNAHGVLLLNSNGMDVKYGGSSLTYKVIGGVLDFYFFAGPAPLDVVQQYTGLIGRPAPMPYWSFGFHQCKYGYKNLSDLKSVVAGYEDAKIPLETIWTDIDHMDKYKIFTLDPANFPQKEMKAFVDQLHTKGQKYVLIVDPGIGVTDPNYKTYTRGMEADIYVKKGDAPYLGQVWPGPVYFPDFLNPKTLPWWTKEISEFHDTVPFDGLWLDMNEAASFCSGINCSLPTDGSCPNPNSQTSCCLVCNDNNPSRWDTPPYTINSSSTPIGRRTMATSAVHFNDILEYDVHNMYGLTNALVTNQALKTALKKRPFILSRSTFVGSGAHAAHWTGDNAASWDDLAWSIPTMLNFGLFGIPMVGADICGFLRGTNEELCSRWIQTGAFYPFSRDHSDKSSPRQELYLWASVTASAKKALGLRYRLLPYIYTLNYEAHTKGYPMARPLFFQFPQDSSTYGIASQFLLGKILVSPVLKQGQTTVDAYFPKGKWYSLFNDSDIITAPANGTTITLQTPSDTINVHVYEGTILPMQELAMTTSDARKTPFSLIVALGSNGQANGDLFLDSGDDLNMTLTNGNSSYVQFTANTTTDGVSLKSTVQQGDFAIKQNWTLKNVTVLGLGNSSSPVLVSNLTLPIGKNFSITIPGKK